MDQQHLKMFEYQSIFKLQEVMEKMFRKVIAYIQTKGNFSYFLLCK